MGKVKLCNGMEMDDLCYGTGIVLTYRDGETGAYNKLNYYIRNAIKERNKFANDIKVGRVIKAVFESGCSTYDTSRAYGGAEYILGRVLRKYERSNYTLVTKLSNYDQYYSSVRESFNKSLSELGVEYIDLYLMHWPVTDIYIDNWNEMVELYKEGKCKAIGVCNFNIHHLEQLRNSTDVMPMVNQFECHPLFTQKELRMYCEKNGISIMAYTPTARMDERIINSCVSQIAREKHKSVSQVVLQWHRQIGTIPVFNTYNIEHLKENLDIGDLMLTSEEIERISGLNINCRLRYDPDNCDFRKL